MLPSSVCFTGLSQLQPACLPLPLQHLSTLVCFCVLQDFLSYSLLAFLYLSSTSLVASAIDYYQRLGSHVKQWTVEQLIVSVVSNSNFIRILPSLCSNRLDLISLVVITWWEHSA